MAVRTDALDTLSECLGDNHDLWVLQQTAAADDAAPHEGLEHARPLIEARREALQAHALALAPRLLVENKGALRTRLASYFVTAARLDAP